MKTTNRLILTVILCIFGILLCVFCVGNAASDSTVEEIGNYTDNAAIVETFYTTNEDGNNYYYIVWEKDNASGIMEVDSAYYEKYKYAETMPLEIKVFDFNKHYIYKRTDK